MHRLFALALIAMTGCGQCGSSGHTPEAGAQPANTNAPTAVQPRVRYGIVEGRVLIAEGATLPSYPPEMMPRSATDVSVDGCSPPKTVDREPVALEPNGRGLTGVLVTASDFRTVVPATPQTHEVHIRDCRLTPMFLDATQGDKIKLFNDSEYPFIPSLPSTDGVAQALVPHQTREIELSRAGVRTMSCGTFGANCGRLDVVTLFHPVHTRTHEQGRFRLENVPADEDVVINAWHPLFAAALAHVRVREGEVKTIELVLTPEAIRPATPPVVPAHPLQPGEEQLQ